ncbi:MAG: NADH-quinone oxidoreductase subunit L [SAR324 cluster bacterium]|jgi:NADH-quinone oxidoreductase subunit L|uniref:NADH:quinone oxidoreductase/Mrp antiporter membrane subunit domain-containing protein n=1 Tax=marine metagenome TaxID=408172 RepID=A0A381Q002_9ZZZZ|nr:NADH-quinone oxidoreductase subunit L [SAR324 cluster bacterium]MDP6486816.1 NADH-quinone oxidoreductase subunit L [SAR324 cluster bacterium]MDP7582869.1 NADH-quinone oxidoreductase subunit L [SAR324 cluster bacterium]MDP7613765.1 NADH-quinone oxidoreductase subunit L [SAR324 cluster bacterium]|tara:strand:+ start:154 stop:2055 length:1902 start_codon:yes stop_codon:yes gene_type:complete
MSQIWLVPAFPLLGFLLNGFLGKRFGARFVTFVGPLAIALSFAQSLALFFQMLEAEGNVLKEHLYTWISSGNFEAGINFQVDQLSGLYLLVITGVGFLIHVYSVGYMDGESGYYRFFAYLNLFVFFMLILVLGDSFLLMFVGWEGVGLCSYLLIGYYFEKDSAAEAAKKAFLFNRIGDFGVLSAVMLIFLAFGSIEFATINAEAATQFEYGGALVTAITLLLFLGATGKSAQIPLYVWLPDAMEGPTPVSALIHAATMVTAGLYMVARLSHLFVLAPFTMNVIAVVGTATALLAATIAVTQTDIKRVLAYSTVSQLGYMFLAMGVGAFGAGVFHVMTHAFFKALLFLGSGSVILAVHHEQDMRKMGALKNKLPITYMTMLLGTFAISGIPFFSGFFSKDEILWKAYSSPLGSPWLWGVGFLTAGLTAFYMFRMIYLTFHGESRVDSHTAEHVHESPFSMTIPLMILAALAVTGGFFGVPHVFHVIPNGMENYFQGFFAEIPSGHGTVSAEWTLMAFSVAFALLAWFFASRLYHSGFDLAAGLRSKWESLYQLSLNKWYVDELYNTLIIQPGRLFSTHVLWRLFDQNVIDRAVNTTADVARMVGNSIRPLQNGLTQNYALIFTLGTFLILWFVT